MANTTVAVVTLAPGTPVVCTAGSGTALNASNTMVITPGGPLEELVIIVQNTYAGTKAFTIVKGDNPPADAQDLGSLTFNVEQDAMYIVPPLSSSRYLQDDGTLHITVAASTTGFIHAFKVPRI